MVTGVSERVCAYQQIVPVGLSKKAPCAAVMSSPNQAIWHTMHSSPNRWGSVTVQELEWKLASWKSMQNRLSECVSLSCIGLCSAAASAVLIHALTTCVSPATGVTTPGVMQVQQSLLEARHQQHCTNHHHPHHAQSLICQNSARPQSPTPRTKKVVVQHVVTVHHSPNTVVTSVQASW